MKTKVIIAVSILIIAMGCISKRNSSQCSIYQSNIDVAHELFTHLVSDENHHYLFGAVEENKLDSRTNEITIDRSIVGNEKNWTPFSENIPGKCWAVCQTTQNIFLISEQHELKDGNPEFSKHKLYRISKESRQIEELYEWNQGNSFIRDVYFDSDEIGYVFFRPSGNPLDYQFLKTNNGGKEWNVIKLNRPVNVTHRKDEKLYFLSYKNNLKSDWIYSVDKNNDNLDSLQLDLNITDFSVGENGEYWLLGQEEDKTVLQRYANGQTTDVHTFSNDRDIFPDQLYKYNELIVVIASQMDENMLFGFGGTKPLMFVSKDNGLTWDNHRLDEALYLKPISFYKDEQMTIYVGNGKILTCKFQ